MLEHLIEQGENISKRTTIQRTTASFNSISGRRQYRETVVLADPNEYTAWRTQSDLFLKENNLPLFFDIGHNKLEELKHNTAKLKGLLNNWKMSSHLEETFHLNPSKITNITIKDDKISIEIRPEIYSHIKRYLDANDYFHAVEESYKVVRSKLKMMTGHEQAHKAFNEQNYEIIFGRVPQTDIEKDFFEGTKFLHIALQNFRNEKAHSLAGNLDKNIAIHYLVLASLAYDLISRNDK